MSHKLPQEVWIKRKCIICGTEFQLREANKKRAQEMEEKFNQLEPFSEKRSFRRTCDNPECKHKYRLLWDKNYRKKNKKKLNAKGKKWDADHKKERTLARRKYNQKLKKWVVDKLGRECADCGLVTEFDCAYDLHHPDNSEIERWFNDTHIRTRLLVQWRKANKIPDGIILLCAVCHRKKHFKPIS